MKKIISMLVVFIMIVGKAFAIEGIVAKSAILMGADGKVLWENNADDIREPASVTKIMTMLLVAEALERGEISFDDMVTGSAHSSSMGGSQIWFEEGEQLSVRDLFKTVAVVSANDAAVALAEHIGGTEENFVVNMNKRAKELGMLNTNFVNCNGLPKEGHVTTARDISIMTREALKHDIIFEFTKIWMDYIRDGKSVLVNTNKMIRSYGGMTGLKTGYTNSAGYCLSATASRDNLDLIAVVMNCPTVKDRTADVTSMLNYGFATFTMINVKDNIELEPIPISLGKEKEIKLKIEGEGSFTVKKSEMANLEYKINLPLEVCAPIEENDYLGSVVIKNNGEIVEEINILAASSVQKMSLLDIYRGLLKNIIGI